VCCLPFSAGLFVVGCSPEVSRTDSSEQALLRLDSLLLSDTAPKTVIGTVDGPLETVFGEIEDVLLLPGRGLVVLDDQALDLRLFSSDTWSDRFFAASREPSEGRSALGLECPVLLPLAPTTRE